MAVPLKPFKRTIKFIPKTEGVTTVHAKTSDEDEDSFFPMIKQAIVITVQHFDTDGQADSDAFTMYGRAPINIFVNAKDEDETGKQVPSIEICTTEQDYLDRSITRHRPCRVIYRDRSHTDNQFSVSLGENEFEGTIVRRVLTES